MPCSGVSCSNHVETIQEPAELAVPLDATPDNIRLRLIDDPSPLVVVVVNAFPGNKTP
ncbi:hypothetical protein [Corallococcus sp. AB045]|uniref:hypothetical protein n=1 Tax=Corallococcus sp. AB045 TaxID=2316719 RepID=UPI0013158D1D|nr:hypothetical protein [Corallococcus sp. AB045]